MKESGILTLTGCIRLDIQIEPLQQIHRTYINSSIRSLKIAPWVTAGSAKVASFTAASNLISISISLPESKVAISRSSKTAWLIVSRQNLQEDCRSADIRIRDWYHPTDS
jgi:hypothetical protein